MHDNFPKFKEKAFLEESQTTNRTTFSHDTTTYAWTFYVLRKGNSQCIRAGGKSFVSVFTIHNVCERLYQCIYIVRYSYRVHGSGRTEWRNALALLWLRYEKNKLTNTMIWKKNIFDFFLYIFVGKIIFMMGNSLQFMPLKIYMCVSFLLAIQKLENCRF